MASQSTHQDDICLLGLMQGRNIRVQETISGHWQSKAHLPELNMSLPELRNTSPYSGCLIHFMATHCAKVSSKITSPGKASEHHAFREKQIWMEFSSRTNHKPTDSQLQYLHWMLRLRPPTLSSHRSSHILFFYSRLGAIWGQGLSFI